MRLRHVFLIATIGLAAACSDPLSTAEKDLRGSWTETEALQPQGSLTRTLTFDADGTFTSRVEMFGTRGAPEVRSSYSDIIGDFTAQNGRIDFHPRYSESWDISDGPAEPMIGPAPRTLFDDCTFEVHGDVLTLHYTTHPADAPVPTTLELHRALGQHLAFTR